MANALQVWLNSLASGGNFGSSFIHGFDQAGKAAQNAQLQELRRKQLELQNRALEQRGTQFDRAQPTKEAAVNEQIAAGTFNRSNAPVDRRMLETTATKLDPQAIAELAKQFHGGGAGTALEGAGPLGAGTIDRRAQERTDVAEAQTAAKVGGQEKVHLFKRDNPLTTPNSPANMQARWAHDELKAAQAALEKVMSEARKNKASFNQSHDVSYDQVIKDAQTRVQNAQQNAGQFMAPTSPISSQPAPQAPSPQIPRVPEPPRPEAGPQTQTPLPGPSMAIRPGQRPPDLFQNGNSGLPQSAPPARVYDAKPSNVNPQTADAQDQPIEWGLPANVSQQLEAFVKQARTKDEMKQKAAQYLQSIGQAVAVPHVNQLVDAHFE